MVFNNSNYLTFNGGDGCFKGTDIFSARLFVMAGSRSGVRSEDGIFLKNLLANSDVVIPK